MLEPVNFNGSLLIHDLDGHRIFLDTNDIHMTVHMLENHIWEPQVRQVIAASLHQGGCYVDVGANVGLHAVYAAGLAGSEGRVYAIEPNKHVYYLLKQNMDINGFFDRARLYNLAVSDGPGIGKMYIYQGHAGGSGLSKEELYMADCEEQTVSMDTLDHILEEEPKNIDVLKIDVEGFEVNVINGSLAVLQKNPDITIIMEWQPGGMIRHVGG